MSLKEEKWGTKFPIETLEEKTPLERPTCRWEDNIKVDVKELGWVSKLDSNSWG
jgi:hypothetical protein